MKYSYLRRTIFFVTPLLLLLMASAQTRSDSERQRLEQEKLQVEKTRVEGDLRLRDEQIKLRREELFLRKEEQGRSKFFKLDAATATIAVAALGLLGTALLALMNNRSNYRTQTDLEKMKLESSLIFKAIETSDLAASTRNLLFLVESRLISDPQGRIAALAKNPDKVPMLPRSDSYEDTHGTLLDVEINRLGQLGIPDQKMENVWLAFRSPAGRRYRAVHVFEYPSGPYVLLSSEDRDREDFQVVQNRIATEYGGTPDGEVSVRSEDICAVIPVASGFSLTAISRLSAALAREGYRDPVVSQLHYRKA
jgi:hypothetical protein